MTPQSSGTPQDDALRSPAAERPMMPRDDKALTMGPLTGLGLSLLVGLAVGMLLEWIMPVFNIPVHLRDFSGNVAADVMLELQSALEKAATKNTAFGLALLAGAVALALAVGELLLRRQMWRAAWGGLLAGTVAAVIAASASLLGMAISGREIGLSRLAKSTVVQGTVFGVAGLGIGFALALPLFRPRLLVTCLTGGCLGGVLAGVLFPIAASAMLPNVNTELVLPEEGLGRILWSSLAAALIGLAVTGLGTEKRAAKH